MKKNELMKNTYTEKADKLSKLDSNSIILEEIDNYESIIETDSLLSENTPKLSKISIITINISYSKYTE